MKWFKRSPDKALLIGGVLSLLLVLVSQWHAEKDLFTAWQTEEYSHGLLIPLIAALLAWNRLAETKPPLRPSWLGLVLLVVAAFMQLTARLSAFDMIAEYGLIVSFFGLSLAFLGRRATIVVTPALFYLIFAVPLPHLVQALLSQRLQLLSSSLGVWPLDLLGIPVYQEGNVIDLGGYRLQVVEACSGLRYLFPLMSFGFLIAFLLKDKMWKRVTIFLSTIPITLGLNALRIAFIGITVDMWGKKMAEGFIHNFEGWTVFLICVAILLGETWILRRVGKRGKFRFEYLGLSRGPLSSGSVRAKGPSIAAFTLCALLALIFASGIIDERPEITPPHAPLAGFPLDLAEWRGHQDSLPSDVLQSLQLSDYWVANYKRPDDPLPVNLYIAYYASQRVNVTTHSPSNCIPGGGWQIADSRVETVTLANGVSLELSRLVIKRGDASQLVYYWFDERGRDLTETTSAKWYLLQDSIFMQRTDGALIRLVTPIPPHSDEKAADSRLQQFLTLIYPKIGLYIPGANAINTIGAH